MSEPAHIPRRRRIAGATWLLQPLGLALCTVLAVVHQVTLWFWYIEDSAISFAFSRNFALGEGMVPWIGSERVEGYSNPTWVILLGIAEVFGADAMLASKWFQAILAGLTVPAIWLFARESMPRRWTLGPLLAAAILAAHPLFAIWGASGLENALFSCLLAWGLWRMLLEARYGDGTDDWLGRRGWGRWPVSAIPWFLLAITRPEGFVYAAAAVAFTVWYHARRGPGWVAGWLLAFLAPFVGWHAARYQYFAWPFPQTYYAKLETKDSDVLRWLPNRGWQYVRDWAAMTWEGAFTPLIIAGAVGVERWRGPVAAALVATIGTAFLLPDHLRVWAPIFAAMLMVMLWRAVSPLPRARAVQVALLALPILVLCVTEALHFQGTTLTITRPTWWNTAAPYLVLGSLALAALAAIGGEEGWRGRLAAWIFGCLSLGFAIQALGDWMRGFRWLSLAAVPMSLLLAVGIAAAAEALARWLGRPRLAAVPALGVLAAWTTAGVWYTAGFADKPETSPKAVRARVTYMTTVADRLKIDEPIRDLDVDQGAHLWWSGFQMYDIAGLVDVPFAQHRFERAFVQEYVFAEMKPHFAHLHGSWATTSRIPTHPEFKRDYFEIPGYGGGATVHVGNFIRRDLVVRKDLVVSEDDRVDLTTGISLRGWSVPASQSPADGYLRLEIALSATKRADNENFRMLVFLASPDGEKLHTWDVAPGYDWLKPSAWKPDEIFAGKYDLELPDHLTEGTYDLGFVFLDATGAVATPTALGDVLVGGTEGVPARVAIGELRYPAAVRLGAREAAEAAALTGKQQAIDLADRDDCAGAERAWYVARMHLPRDKVWAEDQLPPVANALARCHLRRAEADPDVAVAELRIARRWDMHDSGVLAAATATGEEQYQLGLAARAEQDWAAAYTAFAASIAVDPTRAWSRKYAEEARAFRLGFDPETKGKAESDRQRRLDEIKAKNKARPPAAPRVPGKAKVTPPKLPAPPPPAAPTP